MVLESLLDSVILSLKTEIRLNFVDKIEEMFLVSNNRTINKERGKNENQSLKDGGMYPGH